MGGGSKSGREAWGVHIHTRTAKQANKYAQARKDTRSCEKTGTLLGGTFTDLPMIRLGVYSGWCIVSR